MNTHPILRTRAAGLALAAALSLGACASVAPGPTADAVEPSASLAQADARLAAVAVERTAIEARYAEREALCYEKFFVNHCLDEAKERRRVALAAQRNIEIEAERFKRRSKVEERDREMAAAEAAYQAEEAQLATESAPPKPRETSELPPPKPSATAARVARRDARAAQEAARAPLEAAEAAENARAFEERKRRAEQKQRDVAERVAEREAKAAARRAEEEQAKAKRAQQQPVPVPTPAPKR